MIPLSCHELAQDRWPEWTLEPARVWRITARRRTYFIAEVIEHWPFRSPTKTYIVRQRSTAKNWFSLEPAVKTLHQAKALIRADLEEPI